MISFYRGKKKRKKEKKKKVELLWQEYSGRKGKWGVATR